MPQKMLDRYGRVTIARLIAAFYSDMLQSPRLAPHFRDVSVSELVEHQATFMATMMGGPEVFPAEHIHRAHEHLGITEGGFEEMLRLLEYRMRQNGVEQEDVEEVLGGYRRLRNNVVSDPDELERIGQ